MKPLKFDYTNIPNLVLDNMAAFSNSEFALMLLICRESFPSRNRVSHLYLEKNSGFSRQTIKDATAGLVEKGWVESYSFSSEEALELIRQKQPQIWSGTGMQCNWCQGSSIALQEHHYPLPRSLGGTETVLICANCHFEFHQLVSVSFYRPSTILLEDLKRSMAIALAGGDER